MDKNFKSNHLEKVFWPEERITKGDLLHYYQEISKYILPYLYNRPETLKRYPNGIEGDHFYQKNLEKSPPWLSIFPYPRDDTGEMINYALANDIWGLLYLINLGCIDLNVWNSKIDTPENPDYLVFDLDPLEIDFKEALKAALLYLEIFEKIGIKGYPKTSGKRGLHIYIPLKCRYSYDEIKDFAFLISNIVHAKLPKTTSLERMPEKRKKKVYLDFLQNRRGATMAAPYSVRPVQGAFVSCPVTWDEVKRGIKPSDFTIFNIKERLKEKKDLFSPVLSRGINLEKALKKLIEILPEVKH